MSSRFRLRNALWLAIVAAIVSLEGTPPVARARTLYINKSDPTCGDASGKGLTLAEPFCTVNYAANTVAIAGDTFLVSAGRYGEGPVAFTRNGTSSAPITWRATGTVVIGRFVDLDDTALVTTASPNVYAIPWNNTTYPLASVFQTYFPDFDINDRHEEETPEKPGGPPNVSSRFTVRDDDGPMKVTAAQGDTVALATIPGVSLQDVPGQSLSIHPYGNAVPSPTNTDFVVALSGNGLEVAANWNVFDGFTITYGHASTFVVTGNDNRFLNMRFAGVGFQMYGLRNYAENIRASHILTRDVTNTAPHYFDFDVAGSGTAVILSGTGHQMKNVEAFHSWNTGIGVENAPGAILDGVRSHGAPNHTNSLNVAPGVIFRNFTIHNGQDYLYWSDTSNVTIEHGVWPGNIGMQMVAAPGIGKITIRNSIFSGGVNPFPTENIGTGGVPGPLCNWEAGSLIENNVMSSTATVKRCGGGGVEIPVATYMANCINGTYTSGPGPCATFRNNIFIPAGTFTTVLAQGMWDVSDRDVYDPTLAPGSPAINAGIVSGTAIDIVGNKRPIGPAYDIGVYEDTGLTPVRPVTDVVVAAPAQVTTTITAPTSGTTFNAGSATTLTTLAGTAASGRTITACTWTNSLGGGGATDGTTEWTVPSIALTIGSNVVTVTCVNDGGTAGSDMLTVTRSSELLAWLRSMRWRRPETGH